MAAAVPIEMCTLARRLEGIRYRPLQVKSTRDGPAPLYFGRDTALGCY